MIEILINKVTPDGERIELAIIQIENVAGYDNGNEADYVAKFVVERSQAVGVHNRVLLGFPRTKYNVLALLKQALDSLSPKELLLEHGTSSSDLARRQSGVRAALSRQASHPKHHH